jgi:hypothetical protein
MQLNQGISTKILNHTYSYILEKLAKIRLRQTCTQILPVYIMILYKTTSIESGLWTY